MAGYIDEQEPIHQGDYCPLMPEQCTYLEELNPQQREAVTYCDGPQLVIAGAGSGKTRVLTYKILHLLNMGLKPYTILALTFTNKAAREMRERIEKKIGSEEASKLWMGTFHSIFARILRMNADKLGYTSNFTIYDSTDSKSLVKAIIKEMGLDEKIYKPNAIHSIISTAKNALITPAMYRSDRNIMNDDIRSKRPSTHEIYSAYCNRCKIANAMDFDDLLVNTNFLFRNFPDLAQKYSEHFRYILVDEYQDTNFAQHNIILQLTNREQRVCVVGDDAQSIYSFRGANIANILSLSRTFPSLKTFKLERNYRSTKCIVAAANSLIEKNKNQIPKAVFSENEIGQPIELTKCYSEFEEGALVAGRILRLHREEREPYSEIAILYRTNAQSRVLEESLRKYNIPYVIYGGLSFYQRKEIKDMIAYLRLVINPDDDEALRRVINFPARGIGDTTVARIGIAAESRGISMWNVICNAEEYSDILKRSVTKISDFRQLIVSLMQMNDNGSDAAEIATEVLRRTGILASMSLDSTPEGISKKENIEELVNALHQFVDTRRESGESAELSDFLSEVALITDQDKDNRDSECVTLMTVHSAKGLEFDDIIVTGVEDDLFPSAMSKGSQREIEEERRLLYVAMTRARKFCMLTYSRSRMRNGMTQNVRISPFVSDIDQRFVYVSDGSGRYRKTLNSSLFSSQSTTSREPQASASTPTARYSTQTATTSSPNTTLRTPAESPAITFNTVDSDEYAKHSIAELAVGMKIIHSRFGIGEIISLNGQEGQDKIVVAFNNFGQKTLMLQFALFKICK